MNSARGCGVMLKGGVGLGIAIVIHFSIGDFIGEIFLELCITLFNVWTE